MIRLTTLLVVVSLFAGCAASRAYSRAEQAARLDNWEEAVEYYRIAARDRPDRPEYRIALERAQQQTSIWHFNRARVLEAEDRLDEALREYRKAGDFDPSNRQSAFRASEMERTILARIEAARPRPAIEVMREQARRDTQEPVLNPASRDLLDLRFTNASLRDILTFVGNSTGINITYDRDFQDRSITIQLDGPYTVPVSVTGADRLTTITVSLSFNPSVLRVRSVQEGTFMRQGGVTAAFSQQVDMATGRIDLVITRTGDQTGATGGGLLAAVLFDAVAPGSSPVASSGVATGPGGEMRPLQFAPVTVTVR